MFIIIIIIIIIIINSIINVWAFQQSVPVSRDSVN